MSAASSPPIKLRERVAVPVHGATVFLPSPVCQATPPPAPASSVLRTRPSERERKRENGSVRASSLHLHGTLEDEQISSWSRARDRGRSWSNRSHGFHEGARSDRPGDVRASRVSCDSFSFAFAKRNFSYENEILV